MGDKIKFELVSPERKIASGEADSILVPGFEGDFTVLSNHAAYLSSLRAGILTIFDSGKTTEYFVQNGFAEVSDQGLIILAEKALEKSEMNIESIKKEISLLEKKIEEAEGGTKDKIQKQIADFKSLL